MPKLVSALQKPAQVALANEISARLRVADAGLAIYQEERKRAQLSPLADDELARVRADVRSAALAGFSFCIEDVQTAREKAQAFGGR